MARTTPREKCKFITDITPASKDHPDAFPHFGTLLKPLLLVLGWGTCLAAFTLQAIFQGSLLPSTGLSQAGNITSPYATHIFYIGIFSTSVVASILLEDAGRAIISFFATYLLADVIIYFVLALPGYVGSFQYPQVLFKSSTAFVLAGTFPVPLLVELVATITGIALAERLS